MTILMLARLGMFVLTLAGLMSVAAAQEPTTQATTQPATQAVTQTTQPGAKYQITIDTTETPELTEWVETNLRPVIEAWYPQIIQMLPSDGYTAPNSFSITFRKDKQGVADTGGTRINVAAKWFERSLRGEARGAIVHEMVHVVQQYGRARRTNPHPHPNPGWLVEGIADYIRWYKYEPQSHGADKFDRATARYDGAYRPTANFLNYVAEHYDKDIVRELNAEMRAGRYSDDLWKKFTQHTAEELGAEWKVKLNE